MLKIATHNSASGEKSGDFLSYLILPFAKAQSKTIKEQYEVGCRMFDIRVRQGRKNKKWICAHGVWESQIEAETILSFLNDKGDTNVTITYEGKGNSDFLDFFNEIEKKYDKIIFECIMRNH